MLTSLQNRLKRAGKWLPVMLLPFAAQAQSINYGAASAMNVVGTYTDLGTGGTAIPTSNPDDANSAAQAIGFAFTFNGTAFTQFVLNTNGVIKLGNTAPSTAALYYENFAGGNGVDPLSSTAGAADVNLIMPFNFDLEESPSGTADFRVQTTGTAPNRVCTIQWKNLKDKAEPGTTGAPAQYSNFSFQTKLYETSNTVEFVYGPVVASGNAAAVRYPNVGLKGSGLGTNQLTLALKASPSAPWSATTFINVNYGANAHNIDKTGLPDLGRTYRFVLGGVAPPLVNDDPAGAITLPIGATCTPVNGTNAAATTTTPAGYVNPSTAACGIAVNPKDVWYKFTTAASGAGSTAVTITVTGAPAGYLRLFSTTGGAAGPFTEVTCAAGTGNNAVSAPLTTNTLTPNTTYYVFVAGYGSGDAQGAFTICVVSAAPLPANDVAVQSVYTLGTVSSYASPVVVQAVIRNAGSAVAAGRTATLTVSGATIFTTTMTVPAIPVGSSATITFPAYPVSATTGTNTVTVTLPADDLASNNTASRSQTLTPDRLTYVDPSITTFTGGFGSNTTANTTVYVKYRTNATSTTVTAVTPIFNGTTTASNNYQVLVLAASPTGTPGAVLYTSPPRVRPLTGGPDVVAVPGIPVIGDFFVAARQLTTTNFGLAFQAESPLRPATFFISTDGTTFTDLAAVGTNFQTALGVTLRNPLATRNEALAAALGLYPNPAHHSFQLNVPAGSLNAASATLINSLGQVVLTKQLALPAAGGTADFDVSRLAAGVYSLTIKSGNDLVVKRVVVE